jgi:hypothetical protein
MIDWILNFRFNSLIGLLMYWLPACFCAVFYTLRCAVDYQKDLAERAAAEKKENGYYHPGITIGTLIGRGVATILPVVNIWCAAFDLAPSVFARLFRWIGQVFDQPLVPKRNEKKL